MFADVAEPPSFDADVLAPLRAAQAKAEAEAKTAAKAARQADKARQDAADAAQKAAEAQAVEHAIQVATVAPTASTLSTSNIGSHEDWMAAAGISPSDYGYVDYVISHESGWNPDAVNPSSQAGGLPQALPYSKTGCGWGDAVCQLRWANQYAAERYGGWYGAYQHWLAAHWW